MSMPDVGAIIAFEEGTATDAEVITLFAGLVKSGLAWQLQGFYGRTANDLLEQGFIDGDGEITDHAREMFDFGEEG